jgi:hypothetical protein
VKYFLIILLLLAVLGVKAQQNTLRVKYFEPRTNDTLLIDSSIVVASSVRVEGFTSPEDYLVSNGYLIWKAKRPTEAVKCSYRILVTPTVYAKKSPSLLQNKFSTNPFRYNPSGGTTTNTDYGSLRTMGNISRGIGFGNAQDVVVNSNLNLRLNGSLANDVEVIAVISDESTPIQPEGNTQQIQDFDQVYITLKKDKGSITIGDFLMQNNQESYFMKYYKKSRGLQFQNETTMKGFKTSQSAEVAISRGRFSRNRINGIEGNSGPYRLSGANGEIFIIAIAGTENVYLDGKLLTRGEENDYVINYNSGEITFTPRILITQYSRIVVEFQYSDRNYARTVSRLGGSIAKGNTTFYTNFFNEMDLKTQPFQQSFQGADSNNNTTVLEVLRAAGDQQAFLENARRLSSYNTDRIMYKRIESGGISYFEYADDPTENATFYDVSFSFVGQGNGNYNQAQTGANGKVFEYVGIGAGAYAPVEVLISPQRLNVFNAGVVREVGNKRSGIEYALSGLDKNTLSNLDDNDNRGFGLKLFRETNRQLRDSQLRLTTNLNYELVSPRFQFVERFRTVEFDRQWNKILDNPQDLASLLPRYEHIANAGFALEKDRNNIFKNNTSVFFRPLSFSGINNLSTANFQWKGFTSRSSFEFLQSTITQDTVSTQNNFYAFRSLLERNILNFRTGAEYTIEQSSFLNEDSLALNSYSFDALRFYVQRISESNLQYGLSAQQRNDKLPKNNAYSLATIGRDLNLNVQYTDRDRNRVSLITTARQLAIEDTLLSARPTENTLQSRLEIDFSAFKRFVRGRTFYEIGSGQEQRREFQYLEVQPGNGVYIWNDYDSNGLKTLNEFEIASDLDRQRANYIRVFTPVQGFISTNTTKISQTLEFNPRVLVKDPKQKPWWSRFSSLSSVIIEEKVLPSDFVSFLIPNSNTIEDTSLISNSRNLRSTLFFNRTGSVYAMDYSILSNSSKVLLTNGFDSRENLEHIVNSRVNLNRVLTFNLRLRQGDKTYTSQFFTNRSYQYTFWNVEPKLQFVLRNKFRADLKTAWFRAVNLPEFGGETSNSLEVGTDFKFTQPQKGTLQAAISYINVAYNGESSSTLGYELLRGLQNGNNATWNLSYQRTVANNIQLNISYDGRKSEDAPVIHIGRVLARYLF